MIDEKLREAMTEAYMAGEREKALQMSQELDKQIVAEMKGKATKEGSAA